MRVARRRHGVDDRDAARLLHARRSRRRRTCGCARRTARNHQRAAERAAELVPIERRHRILDQRAVRPRDLADEEVARVEGVVAQVLERRAVQLRCVPDFVDTDTTPAPRPNSAENTPVSTLNSRTCSTDGATMTVLNVNSLLSMPSMSQALELAWWPERVEVRGAARVERARAREVLARLPGRDPRRQIDERREVAAVQRQFLDGRLLDDRADLRRVGADAPARSADDRGRLLDAADFERRRRRARAG